MMAALLSVAVNASRLMYLMLFTPVKPGTIRRSGPPWAKGRSSPFISQASRASAMAASGTERSTTIVLGSIPAGNTSPPVPVMNTASADTPPKASTSWRTGTPVQITQPAAPTPHCVPLALCLKKARPLPEHCSTMAVVSRPMVLSSPTLRLRGDFTPSTDTFQASRSLTMAASGGGRLLRTNSWLDGVTTPERKAARRVSKVLLLCMIMSGATFQPTYAGKGLLTAATAVCACAALVQVPRPTEARAPTEPSSTWRRASVG